MSNLMRDPNQPPPQTDLEGVGELIVDGQTSPGIHIVEVRFIPNDIPRFRRDFATAAAAAEFMRACQPDPNAVGSVLQANAKRAKLLRVGVNELTNHSVETEVIRIIRAEEMDASVLDITEDLEDEIDDQIDTFTEGDDVQVDESGLEAEDTEDEIELLEVEDQESEEEEN